MYARGGFPKFLLLLCPWTYISPVIVYFRMRGLGQKTLRSLKTAFPFRWQVIVEVK